jgi:peroxiredoxin
MAQLRQDFEKFIEQDTAVIAVGPDSVDAFKKYWEKEQLPFIGLADSEHTVARQYDQEVTLFKLGRIPTQLIIDKNGIAHYVNYSKSMSDIPENEKILEKLQTINNAGSEKE